METITQPTTARRAQLLARLAAERANLLLQLEGLNEFTLSQSSVVDEWTAAGLLAHLAYWEAFAADRLSKLAAGRRDEIYPLKDDDSVDARNAATQARFAGLDFSQAVAMLQKERRNFLLALGQITDDALQQRRRFRDGWRVTPNKWANWPYRHDAEHVSELVGWRETFPPNDPSLRSIHRSLLRPILGLTRHEFLALAALVPTVERETQPVSGVWSLKQILGHLVDYERLGIVALKAVTAGREPVYDTSIPDFDAFNNERSAVWGATSWDEALAQYIATRRALVALAEKLSDEALARPFVAPWLETTTACGYLLDMAQHEQEHADALRLNLRVSPLPRRLGRAS